MQTTVRTFAKAVIHHIEEASAARVAQMGKGQCKDYPEYTKMCGHVVGLDAAAAIVGRTLNEVDTAAAEMDDELPEMQS